MKPRSSVIGTRTALTVAFAAAALLLGASCVGGARSSGSSNSGESAQPADAGERIDRSGSLIDADIALDTPVPTPVAPVGAAMTVWPREVSPGERAVLVIRARTAPTWHIYPADLDPSQPYTPATIELSLPPGVSQAGEWKHPASHEDPLSGVAILEGEFEFRTLLAVQSDAPGGELTITCTFGFQACDPNACLPPMSRELSAVVMVVRDGQATKPPSELQAMTGSATGSRPGRPWAGSGSSSRRSPAAG